MYVSSFIFRATIVLGLFAAVFTVLYFTPLPDKHYLDCNRQCNELDWPMICRIKLTIESHTTMSKHCHDCPSNQSHCSHPNCITGNGHRQKLFAVNKQYPGPTIQVCHNDILVVDVTNKLPGQSLTIHWHGQEVYESNFMDGVPMVTQCPISSYNTFQYKFRASNVGTHVWEAFSNAEKRMGVFGALIVRQPNKVDPLKRLYDHDEQQHIVVISEFPSKAPLNPSILINGKGPRNIPTEKFTVISGKSYRFRAIYATGSCPVRLSIDEHPLTVVALDGHIVRERQVNAIEFAQGERVDFILSTKSSSHFESYFLRVEAVCGSQTSTNMTTTAEIVYEAPLFPEEASAEELFTSKADTGVTLSTGQFCNGQKTFNVCLDAMESIDSMPMRLREMHVKRKVYLPFGDFDEDDDENHSHMNNLTFTFPSGLLYGTDAKQIMCNDKSIPRYCMAQSLPCQCLHIERINLKDTVELLLINQARDRNFHLHGFSFWVVAVRQFAARVSAEDVQELDANGMLFRRNLVNPVRKDTINVPENGVVAVRFQADNPGYWILRDQSSETWSNGADVIFQVGDACEMTELPKDFPTCNNFVGPEFFLV